MTDLISRLRDLHMQCDGLSLYAEAADEIERLRASLGAIHYRVCHGASTHGMGEAIAVECERAAPELKSLRAALKETP